jgi:hypothetical protein
VLEPENRHLLLDALRPPPGFTLDRAVGTTYSLDLISLLSAPLGFALLEREGSSGRLVVDPVALLEAVRRYADRIDLFCQAGQIAPLSEHRQIVSYLEDSIHQAVPPLDAQAIFHPKMWALRYVGLTDPTHYSYRLLCLSRNLTFDRSWDTMLCLEGERGAGDPRLADFITRLPDLALEMPDERASQIRALGADLHDVAFRPPDGFDRIAFWPLGVEPEVWPFQGRVDRMLVISPFLSQACLARVASQGRSHVLISRPEAFDLLGADALDGFVHTMVISPTALTEQQNHSQPDEIVLSETDEAIAERAGADLHGLHAKLYIAEAASRARVWTGSANATDAAFHHNVELLIELEGTERQCGIDAVLEGSNRESLGLRAILESYEVEHRRPRELTAGEHLERRLETVRRAVAQLKFVVQVAAVDRDSFHLVVHLAPKSSEPDWWTKTIQGARLRCRPVSLGAASLKPPMVEKKYARADFGNVPFDRLTSFVVVELQLSHAGQDARVVFVVNARMEGGPEDRRERTLASLLENRGALVRFLLLLLGESAADDLTGAIDVISGEPSPQAEVWRRSQWHALFEPMVRSLARQPARLDEICQLIEDLSKTPAGRRLLPPDLRSVWEPIWEARQALTHR